MKLTRRFLLSTSLSLGLALGLSGAAAAHEKVKVVTTFSILGDMTARIGGDRVDVTNLVGPDGDAHVYQPSPADARALAGARLVIINGLDFEGWLPRLIDASGYGGTVITASAGVRTIESRDAHAHDEEDDDHGHGHAHGEKDDDHGHDHAHGEKDDDHGHDHAHGEKDHGHDHAHGPEDPHAWLDLTSAGLYVDNIAAALANIDPEGTDTYRANAAALRAEMAALEAEMRAWLATIPMEDRPLVVVPHDAFAYFGRAYGFEFVSPVGTSTETEASARDVAGLVRRIRGGEPALIFGENISDTRLVEQVAREVGQEVAGVLYSGALSPAGGPAPDYVAMMRFNFEALKAAVAR